MRGMSWSNEEKFDWTEFCPDVQSEELPPGVPEACRKPIKTTCCKDSDFAADVATHHLAASVLLFCNNTPIKWISNCPPVELRWWQDESPLNSCWSVIVLSECSAPHWQDHDKQHWCNCACQQTGWLSAQRDETINDEAGSTADSSK